jgi:hypothetical protein
VLLLLEPKHRHLQIFVTARPTSDAEALPLLELELEPPLRFKPTYHRPHFDSDHPSLQPKSEELTVQTSNHVVDSIRASPLEFSRAHLKLTFALSTPPCVHVAPCGTDVMHARLIRTTMGGGGGYWDGGRD